MYFTSISSCLDNSYENKLNLLSKTSWFWSGIAPTFKTLGFENTGDEKIENNRDELSRKFFKLNITFKLIVFRDCFLNPL